MRKISPTVWRALRKDRAHEHGPLRNGYRRRPLILKTLPLSSDYQAWRDEKADSPTLVVQVGKTRLSYRLRCIDDLHAMLGKNGSWVELGTSDKGKPVKDGTVEAWARDPSNRVKVYYGLRKGYRDRFANYFPPVLELLGLAELEHNPRNNRMRAVSR